MKEPDERLNSWKEIAAHLGRTIRTAQRWERSEALPVHRHPHDRRDSVYAFTTELDGWWASRKARAEEDHPRRPVPWRWLVSGLFAVTVLVAVGILGLTPKAPTPFAQRGWVVLADFDNQTGDSVLDKGPWTAFAAGIEQSSYINVVPEARLAAALKRMGKSTSARIDTRLGREICLRENATRLIAGSIARDGPGYLLIVRVQDPRNGVTLRSYLEQAGGRDQVIRALGVLAAKVRRELGESLRTIRESGRPLPELTTPSLEALQLYAEGRHLWQTGKYAQAVAIFQAALAHDPDFAMAHASLGNAYFSHVYSNPVQGREEYQKALTGADRLTDRERLYIQATYQGNLGHLDPAVELFRIYIRAYPDDSAARYRLGTLLMLNERYPDAVEHLQQAIRLDPAEARSYVNLATCFRQTGDSVRALATYSKAFALEPDSMTIENLNHEYGFALVWSGDPGKAREVFSLALGKPESQVGALRSLALLDMYQGKYRDAQPRLRQSILLSAAAGRPLRAARSRLLLAILIQGQAGRSGEIAELDRAVNDLEADGVPQNWLRARIAGLYARCGAVSKAELLLTSLRRSVDRENPRDSSELSRLEGEVALARGSNARAIELLELAARQSSNPLTIESLAHAYETERDAARAAATYELLIDMGPRAIGWEPQQAWLAAHLRLAEAYLALGDHAKAAAAADWLAAQWRNADSDLATVKALQQLRTKLTDGD